MPEYDNTNRGVLFKNDQKDPNDDRDRDYGGQINIEGTEYWLSGWIKTSKAGNKFMSLSVKPKEERSASQQASRRQAASRAREMDDEIPF